MADGKDRMDRRNTNSNQVGQFSSFRVVGEPRRTGWAVLSTHVDEDVADRRKAESRESGLAKGTEEINRCGNLRRVINACLDSLSEMAGAARVSGGCGRIRENSVDSQVERAGKSVTAELAIFRELASQADVANEADLANQAWH